MTRFLTVLLLSVCVCAAATLEEKLRLAQSAADAAVFSDETAVGESSGGKPDAKTEANSGAKSDAKAGGANGNRQRGNSAETPSQAGSPSSSGNKYVVSPSDFIDGRYVGRVGESEAERRAIRDSVEKAAELSKGNEKISMGETDLFFISSPDAKAVSMLKELAAACEAAVFDFFPESLRARFVPKSEIRVFLPNPNDGAEEDSRGVSVFADARSAVVNVVWSENLALEDVADALVRAMLKRVFAGDSLSAEPARWIVAAVGCDAIGRIQSGAISHFARIAQENRYSDLREIIALSASDPELARARAYWLLRALRILTDRPAVLAFAENVSQKPDSAMREMSLLAGVKESELSLRAGVVMAGEYTLRSGGVLSCAASRGEVLRLCSLRYFDSDSLPHSAAFDSLDKHGEAVRNSAAARLGEIKAVLGKINPVYFNAAVSLGTVYENFLSNNGKYAESVAAFAAEFSKSDSTAAAVERAMKKSNKNLTKKNHKNRL